MDKFDFEKERACPLCKGKFTSATAEPKYDPVLVVICPHCEKLLWRPGLEQDGRLYPFDPDADAGGI